jgi:hypothetical protein
MAGSFVRRFVGRWIESKGLEKGLNDRTDEPERIKKGPKMPDLVLTPPEGARPRRRGRPPGRRNRRSIDLARYIEARFSGLTPGQVLAEMVMPTPADLKRAGGSMVAAMATKARELQRELGLGSVADGFAVLSRLLIELAPYVHQRRSPAPAEPAEPTLPRVYVLEAGATMEGVELSGENEADLFEVSQGKSPGNGQAHEFAEDFSDLADIEELPEP